MWICLKYEGTSRHHGNSYDKTQMDRQNMNEPRDQRMKQQQKQSPGKWGHWHNSCPEQQGGTGQRETEAAREKEEIMEGKKSLKKTQNGKYSALNETKKNMDRIGKKQKKQNLE